MNDLRTLRRRGKIGDSISLYINRDRKTVNIDTDDGRICRPYIVVERTVPALQSRHIQQLKNKQKSFKDLVNEGILEYLDVNEEDDSLIALNIENVMPHSPHRRSQPRWHSHSLAQPLCPSILNIAPPCEHPQQLQ